MLRSEWIVTVAEIGNKKAKAFWEAKLTEKERPSLDASPSGGCEEASGKLLIRRATSIC